MKKRTIAYLLTILILSQSCAVYQKTSVPLESAVDKGKVKLISTSGRAHYFAKIEKEDSIYYGRISSDKWSDKLLISPTSVEALYLFDKKESNKLSWVIPLSVVGIFVVIISAMFYSEYGIQ